MRSRRSLDLRPLALVACVGAVALGAGGCRLVEPCTRGIIDGDFITYPVARGYSFDFPFNEYGYALTVGGVSATGADQWKLTFLDSTGFVDREFSGYISAGGGFTVYSPFGGATAMPDTQDPGRILIYGGFGSTLPAGVDFDARSYPIGLQAAVDGSYANGRIFYRDGYSLELCYVDGSDVGLAPGFYPEPL